MHKRNLCAAVVAAVALSWPAYATVTGTTTSTTYTCTGAVSIFTVPFPYLAASQVIATQTTAAGVAATVTGTVKPSAAPTTGTITLPVACPAGSTLTLSRSVPLTQPTSFRTGSYSGPVHEQAFDRLEMQIQQLNAKEVADIGVVNNTVAAFNASGAAIGSTTSVLATGSTTPRTLAARAADVANVKDFNAKGDGTTDDTAAIQAAINTGKDVVCPVSTTYKITNSLYMQTAGQTISGACTITMDAGLAKPMLWLGASDANGTASTVPIVNMKIRDVQFSCTGTKTSGSSGIAFQKATTATLTGVRAWNCYAGIEVRGTSLVNEIVNPDLRQNTVGFWDRTDATGTIDFQGSRIVGGRIEANTAEGIIAGTADLSLIGTTVEGNGGSGTTPEIRLTQGYQTGKFTCVDCHIEQTSTATAVIQVDANACRAVSYIGGFIAANAATTRYLMATASNCTTQAFSFLGGRYTQFKNYVSGALVNNSNAVINPEWSDASRDATADLTTSAGGSILQIDRVLGVKMSGTGTITAPAVSTPTLTTTAATGTAGIQMVTGSLLNLGGTSTVKGDGTGQVTLSGNTFLGTGGNLALHAGTLVNDQTTVGATVKGNRADGASAIGVTSNNGTTLTAAGAELHEFQNNGVRKAAIDKDGMLQQVGVAFAGLGTPANGTLIYCTDCAPASNPCTGASTGALAVRQNGAWACK